MFKGADAGNHECENCGANLPPPDERGTRTCQFCKATYAMPAPAATAPPAVNLVINAPGYAVPTMTSSSTSTEFQPINAEKTKSGCGCATLLVFLVITLAVAIPVGIQIRNGAIKLPNVNTTNYNFGAGVALLPGEPSQPINFITVASHYDGKSVWEVLRFNGDTTNGPVWAATLPFDQEPGVIADETHAYVASGATLSAFKLVDGTKVWQTALTDEFSAFTPCDACFTAFTGRVVVTTKDGTVQAVDSATGTQAWRRDLETPSDDTWRTGNRFIMMNKSDADTFAKVFTSIDPQTGNATATVDPLCAEPDDPQRVDHAGSSFAAVRSELHPEGMYFAFGSSPGCLQLWDMGSGAMTWNVYTPDESYSFTSGFTLAEAPDTSVVVATDYDLGLIAPGGGEFRMLMHDENTEFTAMTTHEGLAVVLAKNTRGSNRTSITGVEMGTGVKRWEVQMGKAASIDVEQSSSVFNTNVDGTFTSQVHGNQLSVVQFNDGPSNVHSMSLLNFDATTGAPGPVTALNGDTTDIIPSFGPAEWRGGRVLVRVGESMQVIDATTGTKPFVFGR